MNYGFLIIYKKANGKLIYRSVRHIPDLQIGEKNSYGWTVIDIQRLYNGKIFSTREFDNKLIKKQKISTIIRYINSINIITLLKIIIIITALFILYKKI